MDGQKGLTYGASIPFTKNKKAYDFLLPTTNS